tara:strand:- start:593 stop:820 length:228 start_codon:yes stop_codon:yes gene_type:complete
MRFIYIEWIDSAGTDEAWTDEEIELARIKSAGILVKETRKSITLAQSRDDNIPAKWDNLLIVPRGAITKRETLNI